LSALRAMLADHATTSIRLVLTPERLVAAESRRTLTALALHGLRVDGVIANRVMPAADPAARGEIANWWRARQAEQRQVLDELAALWNSVSAEGTQGVLKVPYAANEPIGVPALVELGEALYGGNDPLDGASAPPLFAVCRTRGTGRELDSEFELVLRLPGIERRTALELARIDDDLAITVGGVRRLIALPAVLTRCEVVGARVGTDELVVLFRPDPATWMRP
jgi:arsenite-transporting ATPase